jgi:hypothetical protein
MSSSVCAREKDGVSVAYDTDMGKLGVGLGDDELPGSVVALDSETGVAGRIRLAGHSANSYSVSSDWIPRAAIRSSESAVALEAAVETSEGAGQHEGHDEDAGAQDQDVLSLAEIEAAHTTNQQRNVVVPAHERLPLGKW